VYGCKSLGGIGYHNPYTEQGIADIKTFTTSLQDDGIAGRLMHVAVRTWQWHIGTGYNPFLTSYIYPQDESKGLKHIRRFSQCHQIRISIICTAYQENDQYLMEVAEINGFKSYQILLTIP
jgi:hypothetical protein